KPRAHLVVQIFRRKLFLTRLAQPDHYVRRELGKNLRRGSCTYQSRRSGHELFLHTPEGGVDVRVVGLEPVAERAAQHRSVGARRAAFHHEMFAVEEIGGVPPVEGKRREAGKGTERCRGPLPSIAEQIVNAERAGARGMSIDGRGVPALRMKISARG